MSNNPPEPPDPWQLPDPPSGEGPVTPPVPPPPPPPPSGYPPAPPTGYQAPPPGYGYPPGYAAPGGYQGGYPPRSSGTAVAVLVLGIVGLVLLCFYGIGVVAAIVALSLAPKAKREIAGSGGMLTGEGMVKAGVACAWVAVGLTALGLAILVVSIVVSAANADPLAILVLLA